jgi:glycosyltransferase involved in cell wall biosynthesis
MEIVKSGWCPDIIHCRTIIEAGFIAERLSKKFDIPYKITENTFLLINNQTTEFILNNYLSCVKNCEGLSVVSNKVADFFISSNLYKKPYILPNSINEIVFSLKNNTFSQKQIMFVGYNSYIKDIPTFAKALYHLKYHLEYNDFRVRFCLTQIFEQNDIEEIIQIFKSNKIDSLVDIIPQVSRIEIANYYQQSNVFVSTSVAETFGIASLEAMFCGTPVVAVDNGGIRDFLSPKNGILVDKYDYKTVALNLQKILNGEIFFDPKEVRDSVINKYSKINLKQSFRDFYFQK